MNTETQKQLVANQQRSFDNLVSAQNHIFNGFEQLINLNVKLFKSSLDEIAAKSQKVVGLQDVQQAATFATDLSKPSAEQVLNYGKDVFEIVTKVQKEITQLTEKQIADNQQQAAEFVESFAKNAPAGSESAVALVKSGLVAASNATDTVLKASRQAAELSEANMAAASGAAMKTAEQAAEVVERNMAQARKK